MDTKDLLFDDISFSDLVRDVYLNTKKKDAQITGLIDQLKPMIRGINDAGMIVALIKEYLEISVKNDDNLVKLTAIVQRLMASAGKTAEAGGLTELEKQDLLQMADSLLSESKAAWVTNCCSLD